MTRIARACLHRRWIVLVAWIVAAIALVMVAGSTGSNYVNNLTLPGKGSQQASDLLKQKFPVQSGDRETIVIAATDGTVKDAAVKAKVVPMLAEVAKLPNVATVVSPYSPAGATNVSKDGSIAFAQVTYKGEWSDLDKADGTRLIDTARKADAGPVRVELGGSLIEQSERNEGGLGEGVGLLAAIIVLFITFGSFAAMGLPIVTALFGLAVGLSGVGIMSNVLDTANFATQLGFMIGFGVGVDYALFIVTRFRDAYHANGGDKEAAIVLAMNTAGRAVLFAGITVVIALLGMLLLGVNFLYGVAVSASLVVALVMIASLTLTPALLGFWGTRIGNTRRDKRHAKKAETETPKVSAWRRWSDTVGRRPWPIAIVTTLVLLAICGPLTNMRLGSSDAGNNKEGTTTRAAYDLLAKGFGPGFNGPLLVVAQTGDEGKLAGLQATLKETPGVGAVSPPRVNPAGDTAVLQVFPTTSPESASTSNLVNHLRDDVIPSAGTGAAVYVGGLTAAFIDLSDTFSAKLPLFIGIVVLLSALLLLVVFRSLVIPVQAALMNLLSIGASLGVVTLIFQEGWGTGLLGIETGPIEAFLPVMLFAIVFGLSMDYEVFLISRIREEWVRSGDGRQAVGDGLAATGRVITAAATIMIVVFASFITGGERVIMEFGIGLAVAVFIDAFFIRCLLLPAVLHLCGDATWKLPKWLDRILPHWALELEDEVPATPAAAPATPETPPVARV